MPLLVADCPRCDSCSITFDISASNIIHIEHGWQHWYEVFSTCRNCHQATIFVLSAKSEHLQQQGILKITGALNNYANIESYVSLKDQNVIASPEYVPEDIAAVFEEGATCLTVGCFNAAGTMFRLCIDLSTRLMLPKGDTNGLNAKIRRDLGLRLPWLFVNKILPETLKDLSSCIKEDGNDGAHAGTDAMLFLVETPQGSPAFS